MNMEGETTIPNSVLAEYMLRLAHEASNDQLDWPSLDDHEEWEGLSELDASDCKAVERVGTDQGPCIVAHFDTHGTATWLLSRAKYNPPGKAHPAEYETSEFPIGVAIEWYPEQGLTKDEIHVHAERL